MSYIGSTPTTQSFIAGTDYFNGDGTTVNFTLSRAVNSVNDIEVIVNNVEQIPSGYSVSGTTLTFSAAPSSGTSNVYVRYLSTTNLSLAIPSGTSATFNTVTATNLTATTLAATTLAVTGVTTFAAGSAALPAITTTGDTNTGIFFPAADAVAVSTGGSGRVFVNSSGYFGIGKSSPESGLDIRPGITGNFNAITMGYGRSANPTDAVHKISWSSDSLNIEADTANSIASNITFTNDGTERMRIDSSGNLLVGTTTAYGKITSNGSFDTGAGWDTTAALTTTGSFGGGITMIDGTRGYGFFCSDNGNDFYIQGASSLTTALTGGVYLNDRGTSWTSASDERLKTIIEPITDAITKVCQLRTVIGRYNYEPEEKRHPFLIAQDVQAVLPEAVSVADKKSEEQYLGVSYTDTIPLLVAAIKEQQALITALTTRITALENNNATQ
jgi:hypothetical protein